MQHGSWILRISLSRTRIVNFRVFFVVTSKLGAFFFCFFVYFCAFYCVVYFRAFFVAILTSLCAFTPRNVESLFLQLENKIYTCGSLNHQQRNMWFYIQSDQQARKMIIDDDKNLWNKNLYYILILQNLKKKKKGKCPLNSVLNYSW